MNRFDHTTSNMSNIGNAHVSTPAVVSSVCADPLTDPVCDPLTVDPAEAFADWTAEDLAAEVKRQAAEGPLCGYICSATLEAIKQMYDLDPVPSKSMRSMLALDDTMQPGVIRYDHGERQRAPGLPIVHYFADEADNEADNERTP